MHSATRHEPRFFGKLIKWPLGLALAMAVLTGCPGKESAKVKAAAGIAKEAPPVVVADALRGDVPINIGAIGRVEAYASVSIKSQINGQLLKVHFKEGQDVNAGDILFTIDSRTQEAALHQAEADLSQNQAQLRQAKANLERDKAQAQNAADQDKRYAKLFGEGVVSKDEYDSIRTNAEALEATRQASQAAVQNAQEAIRASQAAIDSIKVQLEYCTIHSPISGRTGNLLVNEGNLVKANDVPVLVVINQMEPIYVTFSVPEQRLPEIQRAMAEKGNLTVEAIIPREEDRPETGTLSFIDNTVDQATGTIALKATFPNQDRRLWPGLFVQCELLLRTEHGATTVPTAALQTGQQGDYVYVIGPDQTAELRTVTVGPTTDDRVVIEKGVTPGERVVTDGHLRLTPGIKVTIQGSSVKPPEGR